MSTNIESAAQETASRGRYAMEIANADFNFATYRTDDRKVVGLQIIEASGAHPARDFVVLHHLPSGELETLRPTESVDLGGDEKHRFFVIEGGNLHRFTVDGLSMEWPRVHLTAGQIKLLAKAHEREQLVQVTEQGHVTLGDEDQVSLKPDGAEEFLLKKGPKLVTVSYKHEPYELERRRWTTEELIERFKVPEGYKLDLIAADCEFIELKPGESIKLEEGMEFTSHAPRGQSS